MGTKLSTINKERLQRKNNLTRWMKSQRYKTGNAILRKEIKTIQAISLLELELHSWFGNSWYLIEESERSQWPRVFKMFGSKCQNFFSSINFVILNKTWCLTSKFKGIYKANCWQEQQQMYLLMCIWRCLCNCAKRQPYTYWYTRNETFYKALNRAVNTLPIL